MDSDITSTPMTRSSTFPLNPPMEQHKTKHYIELKSASTISSRLPCIPGPPGPKCEIRAQSRNRCEEKILRVKLDKMKEDIGMAHDSAVNRRQTLKDDRREIRLTTRVEKSVPLIQPDIKGTHFVIVTRRPQAVMPPHCIAQFYE
ncbi:hypothetical protein DPMN_042782 [Dreissena polymorpha]|uniref:Uncharacterized protein n=1 Tax=Dreissena polymorpha TaxID=45954 RepID=A0A9D4D1F3_DREPO|nr:hypothetical protein DPMN_042782 [Dreissena polymorpha]